jgi:hypothetical protein
LRGFGALGVDDCGRPIQKLYGFFAAAFASAEVGLEPLELRAGDQ